MKSRMIISSLAVLLLLSCTLHAQRKERISGNGAIKTETRQVKDFSKVDAAGVFHVYITQGNAPAVKVEADENLLPYIVTEVNGNHLLLKTRKNVDIKPSRPVKVYLTMQEIEALNVSGVSEIHSENTLQAKDVSMAVSGSGTIDLDLKADAVRAEVSGTGKISLNGSANDARYDISGTADVAADDFATANTKVSISGMGKLHVYAKEKLDVAVSGMGNVKYKGNPEISQVVSGMGRVSKE